MLSLSLVIVICLIFWRLVFIMYIPRGRLQFAPILHSHLLLAMQTAFEGADLPLGVDKALLEGLNLIIGMVARMEWA
jgi:hypothetical protein